MDQINCPFCHWHRWRDMKKGAPDFDEQQAIKELAQHLHEMHLREFMQLKLRFEDLEYGT